MKMCTPLQKLKLIYHFTFIGRFFFKIEFTLFKVAEYSSGAIFDMSCEGNSVLNRFESPKLEEREVFPFRHIFSFVVFHSLTQLSRLFL